MQGVDGRFIAQPAEDRFWPKVALASDPDDCWIWIGARTELDYGVFWVDGRQTGAHRFAYELLVGAIPEGLELDHLCVDPPCVNPRHLEPVTPRENVHRSGSPMGINARLARCRKGHEFTGLWRGRRTCRACGAERQRAHRARKAA